MLITPSFKKKFDSRTISRELPYEKYIERETNSPIHHFSPECIVFNQSALRQFLAEWIASRTTQECHAMEPSSFFAQIPVRKFGLIHR